MLLFISGLDHPHIQFIFSGIPIAIIFIDITWPNSPSSVGNHTKWTKQWPQPPIHLNPITPTKSLPIIFNHHTTLHHTNHFHQTQPTRTIPPHIPYQPHPLPYTITPITPQHVSLKISSNTQVVCHTMHHFILITSNPSMPPTILSFLCHPHTSPHTSIIPTWHHNHHSFRSFPQRTTHTASTSLIISIRSNQIAPPPPPHTHTRLSC